MSRAERARIEGKIFSERACANCFIVMYITSAFARNMPKIHWNVYTTIVGFERGEGRTENFFFLSLYTLHSMEYSWDPCSTFHDGMRRYSQNREKCEKLSACIFHLSVVLFSGRRTYSFLPPFDEHINSPWVPCCSQILHSRCVHCSPYNPNKKGKENSRREKGKKNFFQLSTLFRNYFLCFFIFPSFPFQSFASIS